jgi:L-threonine-O-3-phosphate decarboxylase
MTDNNPKNCPSADHIHGGVPLVTFERLGIQPRNVVDFSVNVSPLGPPGILLQNWSRLSESIQSYPSVHGEGIAEYYSTRFGLKRETILAGNGSTECIYLVPRALGLKKVCIVTPSFHDYERSCRLAGAEIIEFPLSAAAGFAPPQTESLAVMLKSVDALLLGNPNNPTGTLISVETILELAERFPDKWLLVDEAFIQFVADYPAHTLLTPERIRKNILVFHSLTKIYDLPGIRMGSVIGHAATIRHLKRFKEPWTVNGIAEKAASLLIHCEDYENRLRSLINKERQRFTDALSDLDGLQLFSSPVNYLLAQWQATDNLDSLLKILLTNGYHVRDCRNFRQLAQNYFRFAILNPTENTHLIDLITSSAKAARS